MVGPSANASLAELIPSGSPPEELVALSQSFSFAIIRAKVQTFVVKECMDPFPGTERCNDSVCFPRNRLRIAA
ncbi:hypothetical protein [Synechococcus sp. FACHB-909]|nr:hypothetical protein [Synechococcus sp. FACHB-909]MBD2719545.1 hypothetical protein [Synechococcus sp. FACHB-909]